MSHPKLQGEQIAKGGRISEYDEGSWKLPRTMPIFFIPIPWPHGRSVEGAIPAAPCHSGRSAAIPPRPGPARAAMRGRRGCVPAFGLAAGGGPP